MSYECTTYPFGRRCGKCENCRKRLQFEKGMRLSHESQYWKDKVFVTLTYSPDNIPPNSTLVKSDLQDFFKRFRYYLPNVDIKYAGCGEYGMHGTFRPHYHAVVFGVNENDERVFHRVGTFKTCPAWDKGFITVAPVNDARCFYVAKYCTKKLFGAVADEYYQGRQPEFYVTSKGIGERWIKDHQVRVKMDNFIRFGKKKMPIPRYYIDKVYNDEENFQRVFRNSKEADKRLEKRIDEAISQGFRPDTYKKYVMDRFRQVQMEYAKKHEFQEKGLKNEQKNQSLY